jgi:stearoyl-CoA desaturase (Delta-9 desaturase)
VTQSHHLSDRSVLRSAGVSLPNPRAKTLERRIAVGFVVVPFIGLIIGAALALRSSVGTRNAALLLSMYTVNILGIGVGFHRLFSHRAFRTTPAVRFVLALAGSIAAQGPVLYWAALHRRHHAHSDRPGDPHSPHLREPGPWQAVTAFWHAHTGWLFNTEMCDWSVYIPDLLRDPMLLRMNRMYFAAVALGLAIPAAAGAWLNHGWAGALQGLLWGGLVRIAVTHHSTWSINSICHIYGRRPFRSNDLSTNNAVMALVTFGEGWHNNHHAFPSSAMHGLRWWQIDFSGYVIRALESIGMAWDVRRPSAQAMQSALVKKGEQA